MKQLTSFLLLLSLTVTAQRKDWLIDNRGYTATVKVTGQQLTLTNGLLSRSFVLQPNAACTDYRNVSNGDQLLRAIQPEARVTLDGRTYNVGGLSGQRQKAYLLPEWLGQLQRGPDDFVYVSHLEKPLTAYVKTRQQPKGRELEFTYRHPGLAGITVKVHYELYDGIPALCKWLSIENRSGKTLMVNQVVNEILAATEEESAVVGGLKQMKVPHQLYVESNYAFNNAMKASLSDQTTHWNADSTYTSQVNYNLTTPCLLEVYADRGIHRALANDSVFTSIRTNELLLDSYDRERNGLAQRRLYRTIAPWTTRNPIFMHLVSTDPEKVKGIVDQCAATGYEGVILSFGSGLNMEDTAAANINKFKQLADYAHAKGIMLGGYSLFSSRRISDEDDVIDPKTGKPGGAFFGHAPCLGSKWGMAYLQKIEYFIKTTGFDIFENDGPYPGDICASTTHPGHRGLDDSQWAQMELQKAFYRRISEAGVYINAPDWYFLDGTHKIALGYREVNFSLPRAEQLILNRQNIYDGTWEKTPAMGWGFVPLSQYQGGGAAATIEPLHEHRDVYEKLMMQYYGAGIQACYRGPRLYDTDSTKLLVRQVINWYKKYRPVLNADIIHLRRADGRDWDGILHVQPDGEQKGLAMLYNPLRETITREITLPVYYTGLHKTVAIREREGKPQTYVTDRDYGVRVKVTLPAQGYTWLVLE